MDTTILLIVNPPIFGLPDPSQKVRKLWGCQEEPNGDGGPYDPNATPIFDNNTAAGRAKGVTKSSNLTRFWVVFHGQLADRTAGVQMPMRDGHSYLPLDDILQSAAEDMIDDIREESDDDGQTWRPYPRSFPTTNTGILRFERRLQKMTIRQQRYLEVN